MYTLSHCHTCDNTTNQHQVGVVSDYDLLALDQLGQTKDDRQLFPQADETWQVIRVRQRGSKVVGTSVHAMHCNTTE